MSGELKPVKAEYFSGETTNEEKNHYRTLPKLLREIADWMDAHDVADTSYQDLSIHTTFEQDDESHYSATLYYMPE